MWWVVRQRCNPRAVGRGAFASVALVVILGLLVGCGQAAGGPSAATPTTTPPASAAPQIVTRAASVDSPAGSDHHLSVSASCRGGEQMVAGGYALNNVFESDYTLLASYPATVNTWRVEATSGSTYQLQALAYCLVSYPSLGIQVVQASGCPAGMTLLSQGLNDTAAPYTLCAARGVTLAPHGFRVGETELDCASQATGNDQSETRSFSYTCAARRATS